VELQSRGFAPVAEVEERRHALAEARAALRVVAERYRSRWQSELAATGADRKALESDLAEFQQARAWHRIASPVNGTVEELASVAPGSFVQAGDRLAVISPDSTKVAEVYISPQDVGLIRVGMPVRLQIDAFRYTDWGFIPARVTEIANDFTLVNEVPVFRVRCTLEQDRLHLPNGATGVVKKGMTLRAHFVMARRSVLNLLRDDVSDWIDPRASGPTRS
jgi:HlyD family secretion protein